MKMYLRIFLLVLALFLAFSMISCTLGSGADTTIAAPTDETTSQGTSDTNAEPANTYTVPKSRSADGKLLCEYTYSEDGLTLTKTDYSEETPITYTVTFDGDGRPLYMEWTVVVNDTRTELWRDEYDLLDSEGRILEERRYCEGDIQNAFIYTYDSEGRMITQTSRNVKQQNIVYTYIYDENGTHVGTEFKKYNGEKGYYHPLKKCTYTEEGRLLTEKSATITASYEYKLEGDLLIGEKVTNQSGDYHWSYYYEYAYENERLIRKDCFFEGVVTETEEFLETEFAHFSDAVEWIFRERLP